MLGVVGLAAVRQGDRPETYVSAGTCHHWENFADS